RSPNDAAQRLRVGSGSGGPPTDQPRPRHDPRSGRSRTRLRPPRPGPEIRCVPAWAPAALPDPDARKRVRHRIPAPRGRVAAFAGVSRTVFAMFTHRALIAR